MIGGKVDPLHQAPGQFLHQSSAHQEYSQLCFRCSIPSVTPGFPRVEGRLRAPITAPVQVDCFLHISDFNIGSHYSCRLDQQVLSQLVSKYIAKRHSSAQGEVVTPAHQSDQRVHHFPVSNTDAELAQ